MGLGRTLLVAGAVLLLAGLVVIALARVGLPLGRLPGDLSWSGRRWSVSVPIVSSLLLSLGLSLALSFVLWLLGRFRR